MSARKVACVLQGKCRWMMLTWTENALGGKPERGSEDKVPIVAAISLNETVHPTHATISTVSAKRRLLTGPE